MERNEILTAVYEALKAKRAVTTKGDFARQLGYTQPALSSAMNGDPRYCSDKLFSTVLKTFPQVNPDFLDSGEGDILLDLNIAQAQGMGSELPFSNSSTDYDRFLDALATEQQLLKKAQEQVDKVISQNDVLISIIKEHLCK